MNFISYWVTPFAKHEIPSSIIWLAEQAERKATGRFMWRMTDPQAMAGICGQFDTAYFKVIEEWGKWREEKDRAEYEAARLEAA